MTGDRHTEGSFCLEVVHAYKHPWRELGCNADEDMHQWVQYPRKLGDRTVVAVKLLLLVTMVHWRETLKG